MPQTTFTDAEGRTWRVPVDIGSVRRCKTLISVDLLDVVKADGKLLAQLAEDPFTLVDVLYALCKPQCDELGVSDEQFGAGLVGDPLDEAAAALLEGLASFFPGPKRRAIQKAVAKLAELLNKREERMQRNFDDPDLAAKLEEALEAEAAQHLKDAKRRLDKEIAEISGN